ncbi:MAG TPA: hypothetical protein VF331_05885 [Polyangiales bacterium]
MRPATTAPTLTLIGSLEPLVEHAADLCGARLTAGQALRAFDENGLEELSYSQALLECEALMRFEQSTVSPVQHATPLHYLLGPDATHEPPSDPRRWGLVHHLQSFTRFLSDVERRNSVLSAFLTSPKGQSLQEARHEERRFQPLTTLLPSQARELAR